MKYLDQKRGKASLKVTVTALIGTFLMASATAMAAPNDPEYTNGKQWYLNDQAVGIDAEGAWGITAANNKVVAVVDTGVLAHPDINGKLLPGYDFRDSDNDASDPGDYTPAGSCSGGEPGSTLNSTWHGTKVAGIIAAETNNGLDVAGIAQGAKILPIRVLGSCGGSILNIAKAIEWAAGKSVSPAPANANKADVINLSLGGIYGINESTGEEIECVSTQGGSLCNTDPTQTNMTYECPSVIQSAINYARNQGVVVVGAAGNGNENASKYYPANCSGVVVVGGVEKDGSRWVENSNYGSNYGSLVDLSAPVGDTSVADSDGIRVLSNAGTNGPTSYSLGWESATSYAAPQVSAAAAMIMSVDPSLSPNQVESYLKNFTRDFPVSCNEPDTSTLNDCGTGILDVDKSVRMADRPSLYTEYTGCNGFGSQYWILANTSNSAAVQKWELHRQTYGSNSWTDLGDYYSKNFHVTIYSQSRIRVRALYPSGWTGWRTSSWLSHVCTGSGGGGWDPR